MSVELTAEALAATTGIFPRKAPDVTALMAAESLPKRWAMRVKRWFRGEQAPVAWLEPPEQDKLQDKVLAPLDERATAAWLAALGDFEVGTVYAATIQNARQALNAAWPKYQVGAVVPEVLPLSTDDYAEVWLLTRTLDDPDTLLESIDDWTLSTSQVSTFAAVYPELTTMLRDLITAELIEHVVKKRPIPWQLEDVIRIVRGLPPEAAIEVPAPVKAQGQEQKEYAVDFAKTRTPAERVESRDARRS